MYSSKLPVDGRQSFLSVARGEGEDRVRCIALLRQYLSFGTSKASKLVLVARRRTREGALHSASASVYVLWYS